MRINAGSVKVIIVLLFMIYCLWLISPNCHSTNNHTDYEDNKKYEYDRWNCEGNHLYSVLQIT